MSLALYTQVTFLNYSVGKELIDTVLDRLRKLADACSGLQGMEWNETRFQGR